MVDVLLINSPLFRNKVKGYSEDSLPPLGLGYIGTELKTNHFDIRLIDSVAKNIPLDELISSIEFQKPKFTGLNIFSTNLDLVKEIVEGTKEETHFLIGGQVTKSIYKTITDFKTFNQLDIIIGEGEHIVSSIVKNDVKEQPFYTKKNRRVFKIDNNSIYFPQDISNSILDRSLFENEPSKNKYGHNEANIINSRGCMYNCAFCGAAKSLNKDISIRIKDENSIKEEVNYLINLYPDLESIRVLDDLFLRNVEDIEKVNRIFNNKLYWRTMAHALSFKKADNGDFKILSQSGCKEVFMGIESGSQKILRSINKTHNLKYLEETITNLLKVGIDVKGYFIYGFPEETYEEMNDTFNLAHKLKTISSSYSGNFTTSVFQFRPYHGTIVYNRLSKSNQESLSFSRNQNLNLDGRLQFNFHAGNFSCESEETVEYYIQKTSELN